MMLLISVTKMPGARGVTGVPEQDLPGGQHGEHHAELVLRQRALHAHPQLSLPRGRSRHAALQQGHRLLEGQVSCSFPVPVYSTTDALLKQHQGFLNSMHCKTAL